MARADLTRRYLAAALLLAAYSSAACRRLGARADPAASAVASRPETALPVVPEADIRGPDFMSSSGLETVRFEYDRYDLRPEDRETLRRNAGVLRSSPGMEAIVEGHCDERGTIAYNLALGQMRAKAVRDYYRHLGVEGGRIATRSLGEESPVCEERTEECWAENRRSDTKVRRASPRAPEEDRDAE